MGLIKSQPTRYPAVPVGTHAVHLVTVLRDAGRRPPTVSPSQRSTPACRRGGGHHGAPTELDDDDLAAVRAGKLTKQKIATG
jgi:hypothetical protein